MSDFTEQDVIIAYRVLKIRQRLLKEDSDARKALSIIQLWEIISHSTLLQRDLGIDGLGIDMNCLKQYRHSLAHCNTFNYEELNPILDILKSNKCAAYLLGILTETLDKHFSNTTIMVKQPNFKSATVIGRLP